LNVEFAPIMDFTRELQEALTVATTVGEFLRVEYALFEPIPNAPAHISTHADRESQELILKHLRKAFPNDGIVAEEKTETVATAPKHPNRTWVIDPIDGTRGFAVKNGQFSVMIGMTFNGRPVVGVVLEPILNRLTYAALGHGCWIMNGNRQPARVGVTACETVSQATLTQSHSKPGVVKPVAAKLQPARIIETYSAGIKLAQVACGEADLYVNEYSEFNDWDICAGEILVIEAGGTVSEFSGQPVRYGLSGERRRAGMLASNGKIHAEAVAKLRA
jgi:3'(2'), 5'-bisphosphate nucleotidase